MRALPLPQKAFFLVGDVVTTSSAFLTDKEEVLLQYRTFLLPAFLKSKEHVYTTTTPLKKPASQL